MKGQDQRAGDAMGHPAVSCWLELLVSWEGPAKPWSSSKR